MIGSMSASPELDSLSRLPKPETYPEYYTYMQNGDPTKLKNNP